MEATKRLNFSQTIQGGIQIGLKNGITIIGAAFLYVITVWIPYLNIGTTIALFSVLPVKLSKGESFSPTEIFNAKYRENMSNYFILLGLINAGMWFAFLLAFVPMIIVGIAWMLAAPLVINNGIKPIEALNLSYKTTYGSKWVIFFSFLIILISGYIVCWILGLIPFIGRLLVFIASLVVAALYLGVFSQIYKSLVVENPDFEQEG